MRAWGFFGVLFLFPALVWGQSANFEESFDDQDLSGWSGTTDHFEFIAENGNILLHQNADEAGISWLSIPSANVVGYWEFYIRFGFNPSANNFAEVYLMSDNPDLTADLNGYKFIADGNGDIFRIYRITSGIEEHEVLAGTTDISDGGGYRVKISRDIDGNWKLETAKGYTGVLNEEATGFDDTHTAATHFGFKNTYTSTRSNQFYYDFKIDLPPFEIEDTGIFSSSQIDLAFSREFDFASVQATDFTVNPGNKHPQTVTELSPVSVRLNFAEALPGGAYEITISNINDLSGETALADTSIHFFMFDEFSTGDVVINEFLKDPPSGAAEYIELRNVSPKYLNLQNWKIGDNSNLRTLDEKTLLLPDDFLVISGDTTALAAYFGTANYHQLSLPALNNGADQIRVYDASNQIVDSLEYNASWGGVKIALERREHSVSAIYKENWGESPSPDAGTPGKPNLVEKDITAPEIISFIVEDANTIIIGFSERVNSTEATDISNYSIAQNPDADAQPPPLPEVESVNHFAPDSIQINLDKNLQEYDEKWILQISALSDIFGNSAALMHEFEFHVIANAKAGDVAINEFMYDPASGFSEFIELFNHSDSSYSLQNWTLNDNTGSLRSISDDDIVLASGAFIILAPDQSIAALFPDTKIIEMGSRFPALNNGSDAIVIRNQFGEIIDSLTYFSDWGGKEKSLERRRADISPNFAENWGDSPSQNLATPGFQNEIELDLSPPEIVDLIFIDEDSLKLVFSERLDSVEAVNQQNFSLNPDLNISEILYERDEITLVVENPFSDGVTYQVTAENQSDVFGNTADLLAHRKTYVEFSTSAPGEVVINEILYKKNKADDPEFVELHNHSDYNFNLSNWTISDATGSASIPPGIVLRSGEYLVFTNSEIFANSIEQGVYVSGFPSLNDDEDAVYIKNEKGILIDSLYYYSFWGGNEGGISIERKDPLAASNDASNWASSTSENGTSAGRKSSVFEPDVTAPEIIFAKLLNQNTVHVVFSEFVDASQSVIKINNHPASVKYFDEANANIIVLKTEYAEPGQKIEAQFKNVRDVKGNLKEETSLEVAQRLQTGNVIINEILFDPLANPDDNLPDQTEYIELYNRAEYAVSLEGFYLHDQPDENGEVRAIYPFNSAFKWIPSESYVIVYAEDQANDFKNSRIRQYFELNDQDEAFTIRLNRSSLSLGSSNDAIYLADSSGLVIDSVFYDESWHNPNLHSTKGISLERIDPEGPDNDASNWSSSTEITGGTPGYQNSIFQQAGAKPEGTGISFSSNPFSPDNDGFDDNLFINYTLDHSDYLLRIRIFDRYGRLVRELADGKPAGFEGSLIWDGLTDDKRKNRVGIYIVLFEAYNSTNGSKKTFKETVVLARKFR